MEFDRIRLATSVVNRILNTYDAINQRRALPTPLVVDAEPPRAPDPTMAGANLELRLEEPVTGAATPEGEAAGEAALLGRSPLDGILTDMS